MISQTDTLFAATDSPAPDRDLTREILAWLLAQPASDSPFDWAVKNVVFNEPQVKGPFNPVGRRYMEELVNNCADTDICKEQTLCLATGAGKTTVSMITMMYRMAYVGIRALRVMPTTHGEGGAVAFARTRLIPALRATPSLATLIPRDRHKITGQQINIGASILGMVGSNSPAQVASNRCNHTDCDEVDKFKKFHSGGKVMKEAGSVYLVGERCKGVSDAWQNRSSSPTTPDGIIWEDLFAGDLRRRLLPCPRCNSQVRGIRQKDESVRNISDPIFLTPSPRARALAILKKYRCESQIEAAMQFLTN